jgi:hypothetical protein
MIASELPASLETSDRPVHGPRQIGLIDFKYVVQRLFYPEQRHPRESLAPVFWFRNIEFCVLEFGAQYFERATIGANDPNHLLLCVSKSPIGIRSAAQTESVG